MLSVRRIERYDVPPERLGRWLERWAEQNAPAGSATQVRARAGDVPTVLTVVGDATRRSRRLAGTGLAARASSQAPLLEHAAPRPRGGSDPRAARRPRGGCSPAAASSTPRSAPATSTAAIAPAVQPRASSGGAGEQARVAWEAAATWRPACRCRIAATSRPSCSAATAARWPRCSKVRGCGRWCRRGRARARGARSAAEGPAHDARSARCDRHQGARDLGVGAARLAPRPTRTPRCYDALADALAVRRAARRRRAGGSRPAPRRRQPRRRRKAGEPRRAVRPSRRRGSAAWSTVTSRNRPTARAGFAKPHSAHAQARGAAGSRSRRVRQLDTLRRSWSLHTQHVHRRRRGNARRAS